MEINRGVRGSLESHININNEIKVSLSVSGNAVYDYTCFGLDASEKLSDDRYMIFYNQEKSPDNEIRYQMNGNIAEFKSLFSIYFFTSNL